MHFLTINEELVLKISVLAKNLKEISNKKSIIFDTDRFNLYFLIRPQKQFAGIS
jgi:hypothetical protein